MSIINMLKKFLQKTAGKSVKNVGLQMKTVPESNSMSKFTLEPVKMPMQQCVKYIVLVVKFLAGIFLDTILFLIVEHFVPELREEIPYLYDLVDFFASFLNSTCELVCKIFSV